MHFLRFFLVFGILIGQSGLKASDVVELRSSPEKPLFIDFLLPYRALELFSSSSTSSSLQIINWHFENEVRPFFQILKEEAALADMLEGVLKSWDANLVKEILEQGPDEDFSKVVERLETLKDLSLRQKAVLTSIFNLQLLQDLQEKDDLESQQILKQFFQEIERSPLNLKEFFKIDSVYFSERLNELEALNLLSPEMTDLDIAKKIFQLRQDELIRTDWGSQEEKNQFIDQMTSRNEWGVIDQDLLSKLSENSWQTLEASFFEQMHEAWLSERWNPLRADASITRVPSLIGIGLALRYLTRWVRVTTGITQSSDLFLRQLVASSGLSKSQIEAWVKDPSKSHYPESLKRGNRELLRKPDFRTAFDGARRLELERRLILNFAEQKFGPHARERVQQFIELEIESKGLSQRVKMNAICSTSLSQIEAGGLRLYSARRKIQAQLARTHSLQLPGPSLKRRIREFFEEDFGFKNKFFNYLPLEFRKSWIPIRRNPQASLAKRLQALESLSPRTGLRWLANPKIPSGSYFKGAWPLEYVSKSFWGNLFSKLGKTSLWASGFFGIVDSLSYWRYLNGPQPNPQSPELREHPILKKLLEEKASDFEIQAWSIAQLNEDLKTFEYQKYLDRKLKGFIGISFFIDPRSAFSPELETSRVSSVFVLAAPHESMIVPTSLTLENALILRFDSVWEPEDEVDSKKLEKAYWKLSQIIDVSKFSKSIRQEFFQNLEIIDREIIWMDPSRISALSWRAPDALIFSNSE
ncbi:MAG: hypothetical protein ACO3LE_04260 [Bdellovibrionota bacterium]